MAGGVRRLTLPSTLTRDAIDGAFSTSELSGDLGKAEQAPITRVPILLYHSISGDASPYTRPYAVTPEAFREQLDCVVGSGSNTLSVSSFARAIRGQAQLPDRPVVITFDDGFLDFADVALPALLERGLAATVYVTSGFLRGRPGVAVARPFDDPMLFWSQLTELAALGVEIGGHSHSHPHLDALPRQKAWNEIVHCRDLLESELGTPVLSFAYPHGYSSSSVRRLVHEAGFHSACGVKNVLSSTHDDPFALARLTVRSDTSLDDFAAWVRGGGARTVSGRESFSTRLWRFHRRMRAVVRR